MSEKGSERVTEGDAVDAIIKAQIACAKRVEALADPASGAPSADLEASANAVKALSDALRRA